MATFAGQSGNATPVIRHTDRASDVAMLLLLLQRRPQQQQLLDPFAVDAHDYSQTQSLAHVIYNAKTSYSSKLLACANKYVGPLYCQAEMYKTVPTTKVAEVTTSTPVFGDGRISTHADLTSTRRAISIGTRLLKQFLLNFTSGCVTDLSDFGILWEQSFPKWEITCPGRR